MGPNFDASATFTFVTEFSNKLVAVAVAVAVAVVVGESVFVSYVFVLLIMERCNFKIQYLDILHSVTSYNACCTILQESVKSYNITQRLTT